MDEPATPYPPRYRWMKRLIVAYALVIGAIVGMWAAWDVWTSHRLEAEIARLRGLGQRVLAEDFASAPVPDDENAAMLYKKAIALTFTKAQDDFMTSVDWDVALTDEQRATLNTFPITFATNLQRARDARARNRSAWGMVYRTPLAGTVLPLLTPTRELALTQRVAAIAYHLDGNDAETMELVLDILHLEKMFSQDGRFLIDQFLANGFGFQAYDVIDQAAPDLSIDAPQPLLRNASTRPTTQPARPASRKQVEAVIAALMDEEQLAKGFANGLAGEQASIIDTTRWVAAGPNSPTPIFGGRGMPLEDVVYLIGRPMYRQSAIRSSARLSQRVAAAGAPNLPAMRALLPQGTPGSYGDTPLKRSRDLLGRVFESGSDRAFVSHCRTLATRRAAAMKLAIRLYQFDHQGELPRTLEQVTAYLPKTPLDPFASDGRPMRYAPRLSIDLTWTPAIYSVGDDGLDGRASTRPTRPIAATVWQSTGDREDLVFPYVLPKPAEPTPASP